MNNKTMMMAGLLVGAALMWKRAQAQAAAPAMSVNPVANSFNNDMWKKILGGSWSALTQNGDAPFLMRNVLGQVTTGDGKPIDNAMADILPTTYMSSALPVDLTAASGGVDYLGQMGW